MDGCCGPGVTAGAGVYAGVSGDGDACKEGSKPCFSPQPIRSRAMRGLSGAPTPPALVLLGGPKLDVRADGTDEAVDVRLWVR